MPITTLDVDPVWQWQPRVLEWSEIEIGTDPRITVDAADRPVIGYNYMPANGASEQDTLQHRVVKWTGARWQRTTLDAQAGLYGVVNVQAGGGVARAYVNNPDTETGLTRVRVYQSHDGATAWDRGSVISTAQVHSTYKRDPLRDLLLDGAHVRHVSFSSPEPLNRVSLHPIADSYVRAGSYENRNFGSEHGLLVKKYGATNSNTRVTFLKFDLDSADLNGVESANLKLYARSLYNTPLNVSAYMVFDDSWGENTITWRNKPLFFGSLDQVYVGSAGREYSWDVTDYVANAAASDGVVSIALWSSSGSVNTAAMFYSREHSRSPVLEIEETRTRQERLGPIADAFVRSGIYADTSYHGLYDLIAKRDSADDGLGEDCATAPTEQSNYSRIAYLKFDVGSLPADVSRAVLRLYNNAGPASPLDLTAFLVEDDTWQDDTITWNNAGPCTLDRDRAMDAITIQPSSPGYVEFDLTPWVADQAAGDGTLSVALYRTGPASSGSIELDSIEAPYGRSPTLFVTH